jgi:hypothetical protein
MDKTIETVKVPTPGQIAVLRKMRDDLVSETSLDAVKAAIQADALDALLSRVGELEAENEKLEVYEEALGHYGDMLNWEQDGDFRDTRIKNRNRAGWLIAQEALAAIQAEGGK